jgi:flavin-dependent dehydrogenase
MLLAELSRDEELRERLRPARLLARPVILGPLAVDLICLPPDGLLLAGDAGGFVDPMTGDGLRFAVRGGELAAGSALDALASGWNGIQRRFADLRRREFRSKWRFNRALRVFAGSPLAVRAAARVAPYAPALVRAIITRAGDCDVASALISDPSMVEAVRYPVGSGPV